MADVKTSKGLMAEESIKLDSRTRALSTPCDTNRCSNGICRDAKRREALAVHGLRTTSLQS